MKALVYTAPETLVFCEVPEPSADAGEVLVRVEGTGICGSDMHAFLGHDGRRSAPLILGHEAAGVIAGGPRRNERVTINPLVSCETCRVCLAGKENLCPDRQIISMSPRQGAFAELVAIPESNLVTVPDEFSLEKAALAEPLAVSWHAVRLSLEILDPAVADGALVIGGGTIGLTAALVLRAMGVDDVTMTEPNPIRREFLNRIGGIVAAEEAKGEFSLIVDAVGIAATRALATAYAAPGGIILHIGLGEDSGGIDARRMTLQEITFMGTYTYTAQDFRDAAEAMFSGRLGPLDWFEVRPLSDGGDAFESIRSGRSAAPKIILKPNFREHSHGQYSSSAGA